MAKAKICLKTYGCSANLADSEAMLALLQEKGFKISSEKEADLIVINSCTVKGPSESSVFRDIKKFRAAGKKIIVSGCVPQADSDLVESKLKKVSIVGVFNISKIGEAVSKTLDGERVVFLDRRNEIKVGLKRQRKNKVIAVIPISEGCIGACTYCKTKHARGDLFSFPIEEIRKEFQAAIDGGCKEIWITSQDTAAYGLDSGTTLVELLKELLKIKGNYKIRIGMGNPEHFAKIIDDLFKLMKKDARLFWFLHIPVQSGSDAILKKMNRKYNVGDFKCLLHVIRHGFAISTDIICGFPGETEDQFQESIDLVEWIKPDFLNISMFWPRPGTAAAKMKQGFHPREARRRTRILTKVYDEIALEKNKEFIGKVVDILIDEKGKKPVSWIGRTQEYKPVVIKSKENLLGKTVKVNIESAERNYLVGKII